MECEVEMVSLLVKQIETRQLVAEMTLKATNLKRHRFLYVLNRVKKQIYFTTHIHWIFSIYKITKIITKPDPDPDQFISKCKINTRKKPCNDINGRIAHSPTVQTEVNFPPSVPASYFELNDRRLEPIYSISNDITKYVEIHRFGMKLKSPKKSFIIKLNLTQKQRKSEGNNHRSIRKKYGFGRKLCEKETQIYIGMKHAELLIALGLSH